MCKVTIDPGGVDVLREIERLFGSRRFNSGGFLTLRVTLNGLTEYERVVLEKTFNGQRCKLSVEN